VAEPSVRAASPPNYRHVAQFSMGVNYGLIFRRLWTKVHQITSVDAGEIVVCNAVFRLSISCSFPEIFAIEERSRPKSHQKHLSAPFWGEDPQIFGLVFKIAPISDHVAKFRGDRPRDRGDLAVKKKRKKQQQNIRAARCVIATERAALISGSTLLSVCGTSCLAIGVIRVIGGRF